MIALSLWFERLTIYGAILGLIIVASVLAVAVGTKLSGWL